MPPDAAEDMPKPEQHSPFHDELETSGQAEPPITAVETAGQQCANPDATRQAQSFHRDRLTTITAVPPLEISALADRKSPTGASGKNLYSDDPRTENHPDRHSQNQIQQPNYDNRQPRNREAQQRWIAPSPPTEEPVESVNFWEFSAKATALLPKLDSDSNGYLNNVELKAALQADIYKGQDGQVLAALYTHSADLANQSDDEYGWYEDDGVTSADLSQFGELANEHVLSLISDGKELREVNQAVRWLENRFLLVDADRNRFLSASELRQIPITPATCASLLSLRKHFHNIEEANDDEDGFDENDGITEQDIRMYPRSLSVGIKTASERADSRLFQQIDGTLHQTFENQNVNNNKRGSK